MKNIMVAEVFDNIVFKGKRRYYIEDLSERDYYLENTTPYQLKIMDNTIEATAWGVMLCRLTVLLLELFPQYRKNILLFKCPWSKAVAFSNEPKTNYKKIEEGLFLNCNHTALHSCWFLQDLLDFFSIDKASVSFLIHRPSSAEPKRVKEYIEKRFKKGFAEFLITHYQKSEENANKAIINIEKHLNPILASISRSYTNYFLFDDNATMHNYIKKTRGIIGNSIKHDVKAKEILNKYLDWLISYYKN